MKKLLTTVIVLLPILSVYETSINKLSYGDAILLVLLPIYIVRFFSSKRVDINRNKRAVFIFLLYLFVTFLLQLTLNTDVKVLSTVRYLLYLIYLLLVFKEFDFDYGIKLLEKVTLLISTYVIIQFLFFTLYSKTLPWYFSASSVMDQNFIQLESRDFYLNFYRPSGLFAEPSHFAQFTIVYLTYTLLSKSNNKIKFKNAFLVSFAILLSGSSLGLISLIIIWGSYILLELKDKFSPIKIMLMVVLITVASQFLFKIEYFEKIINRMIVDKSFSGAAVGYRFDSLQYFFTTDIPLINWFIGFGRGTENQYFTGIFYFLANNGIIGVSLYLVMIKNAILSSNRFGKWLTLIVFILSIGSEYVANFGILFYFSFIYASHETKKLKNSQESVT